VLAGLPRIRCATVARNGTTRAPGTRDMRFALKAAVEESAMDCADSTDAA